MEGLLFKKNEKKVDKEIAAKIHSKYDEVGGEIKVNDKVMMKKNHQVGEVMEMRGKRAVLRSGCYRCR